ncbi:zinc finger, CCHC-type containing protein, partial [Tanacetum coccineum]
LRSGKIPSRSFRLLKSLIFSGSFGHLVHLGFHLLLIGLGANLDIFSHVLKLDDLIELSSPIWSKNYTSLAIGECHLPIKSTITSRSTDALPEAPPATATAVVRNAYTRRVAEQQEVACLMRVSMTLEIQKNLEDRTAFQILQELKTMFQHHAKKELVETVKAFYAYKQEEGQSVSSYVLNMKAYLDQMERLVYPMPLVLGVNLILTSLLKDYDPFMQNYNMHDMGKTIPELHAMLKLAEKGIHKKAPAVLAIRQGLRRILKMNKGALDLYVGNGNRAAIEAIWSFDLILPSGMVLVLDNCHFAPSITREKRIAKLQHDGLLESTDDESFDVCVSCISRKMARKPFSHASERADDLLGLIHSDVCGPFRTTSREEVSGSILDFDEVQRQDAQPSDNTSEHQPEAEHDNVDPQTDVNPIRRSARIPRAPEQYGFYVDAEEHELGYHEMQSMKDNQVWILVDLPSDCKTVGIKWLFKKKTNMDGNIHTYKARLLAKGFTQTYRVDYKETFSLVADIKVIRILIAIVAYYDYEIWQMDVKTAFLNGRLNKDVYMVQPEGFVNHTHPRQMDSSKRGTVPLQPNVDLMRSTRPNVAFSQNLTSRYQQNPGKSHWTAIKNILKYLRNTKDMFLVYGDDSTTKLSVTYYTDASWETDRDDLRSQTGYVFMMNGGAVDWKSSKQSTTVMSSMKAEYIVASEVVLEAIWIRKFISGLGVIPNNDRPMNMYCDNTGAITIAD